MNRIVHKEHYPVDKLPDDLKLDLPAGARVRVTLEVEEDHLSSKMSLDEIFAAVPTGARMTNKEIDDHIRHMRDAWDD